MTVFIRETKSTVLHSTPDLHEGKSILGFIKYWQSSLEQSIYIQVTELVPVALVFTVDLSFSKPSVCCASSNPKHSSRDLHHHHLHLQLKDPSQLLVTVLSNLSILSLFLILSNFVSMASIPLSISAHVPSTAKRQFHYP